VITPLSTEVIRMMEADHVDYQTAKWNLAKRLDVPVDHILDDPNDLDAGPVRTAVLTESVILSNRFALAAKIVDRHDVTPDGVIGVKEAQQAAMNLESIPRYDHIFIIVLENKATSSIKNSPFAPKINAYLNANNQFVSYFATGNPSEPNRIAMTAGDVFGITDDSAWNCMPVDDTADAPEDPLPAGLSTPCVNATTTTSKTDRICSPR
jgi:tRNA (Thr-GGU) A37 N-methylase